MCVTATKKEKMQKGYKEGSVRVKGNREGERKNKMFLVR
jgi:hypothetical protein